MSASPALRCLVLGGTPEVVDAVRRAWGAPGRVDAVPLPTADAAAGVDGFGEIGEIDEDVAVVVLDAAGAEDLPARCRQLRERTDAWLLVRPDGAGTEDARRLLDAGADDLLVPGESVPLRLRVAARAAVERRRDRAARRREEERWALLGRGTRDGLWHWDLVEDRLELSPRWFEMVQSADEAAPQPPAAWLDRVHPADRGGVLEALERHLDGATPALEVEYRIDTPSGFRRMAARGIASFDEEGRPVLLAGSQTDVTDFYLHDALTGLPNRRLLLDRIQIAIERTRREKANHFAVLTFDLDRFQRLNDGLDHRTGDRILREVARRLRSAVRSQDTAAALGGDGFAVLVDPLPGGERQVASICERLLTNVRRPIRLDGRPLVVTASLGLVMGSAETVGRAEDVLRDADVAMERAKAAGGDRWSIFSRGMRQQALRAVELEAGLRDAFDRDQLRNHYQPILELASGRTIGVEALTRWSHPELGLVPPDEFIPIAEQVGLIVRIGDWALQDACRRMAGWLRDRSDPDLSMSVNVSVRQFESPGLVDRVESLVRELDLPPERLRLEITESALVRNPNGARDVLEGLRALGPRIVLDDFGTGYSSLSYLHRFRFDVLKIDRSFVSRMHVDPQSFEIVRTIVELGRSLGLELVAEGIEEKEQLDRLIELGCPFGQGFLFARPGPAEEVERALGTILSPRAPHDPAAADGESG